jgi:hypothetical protein
VSLAFDFLEVGPPPDSIPETRRVSLERILHGRMKMEFE